MDSTFDTGFDAYNSFCKGLREGSILYNVDCTNGWGDYLLVVNKSKIQIGNVTTYSLFLIGLSKVGNRYVPSKRKISLTPEYASHIPFLKYVGYCKFDLIPSIMEIDVNIGLVATYGNTDLHKFAKRLHIRKPQKHKYDRDGRPVIKKTNNN